MKKWDSDPTFCDDGGIGLVGLGMGGSVGDGVGVGVGLGAGDTDGWPSAEIKNWIGALPVKPESGIRIPL